MYKDITRTVLCHLKVRSYVSMMRRELRTFRELNVITHSPFPIYHPVVVCKYGPCEPNWTTTVFVFSSVVWPSLAVTQDHMQIPKLSGRSHELDDPLLTGLTHYHDTS